MGEPWRNLPGKVVMVTGASSGIGREFCLHLANSGCNLIVSARRLHRLTSLCNQINLTAAPSRAVAVQLDVSSDGDSIDAAVQTAWDAFGRIDALINNAGVRGASLTTTPTPTPNTSPFSEEIYIGMDIQCMLVYDTITRRCTLKVARDWMDCEFIVDYVGSIDGLVLGLGIGNFRESVILCNPSLQYKTRILCLPTQFSKFDLRIPPTRNLYIQCVEAPQYGLGYDPSTKDYKIVGTYGDEVWVYSLKTNSWRAVIHTGYRPEFYQSSLTLVFNHGVVWLCSDKFRSWKNTLLLVWFDFGTERFRYSDSIPNSNSSSKQRKTYSLVSLEGGSSVGVWEVDYKGHASVWSLNTTTMSWTIRHTMQGFSLPTKLGYDTSVNFIEKNSGELVWSYFTRKLRKDQTPVWNVVSYNIKAQTVNHNQIPMELCSACFGVYCESLLMLNE